MPATTSFGQTTAQHRAMLRNLITIGSALNRESWEDDLERIPGVGPKYESVLRAESITTFAQLGALDDEAKAQLELAFDQFPLADLDSWIESAKVLAADYAPGAPVSEDGVSPPQAYLQMMKQQRGRPIDGDGVSTTIVRIEGGPAVLQRFEAFDAPSNHPAIYDFVSALRAFVAATDGTARVPDLDDDDIRMLTAAHESLVGDG